MRLLRLVLLSGSLVGCRAPHAGDSSDDANRWQGTWKLVSCTYDGQSQMADTQWIVDGDHYNIRLDQVTHVDPIRSTWIRAENALTRHTTKLQRGPTEVNSKAFMS